jgi:hypothetical protein
MVADRLYFPELPPRAHGSPGGRVLHQSQHFTTGRPLRGCMTRSGRCLAEIPGWCVATRWAAQNQSRSDVRVPCITVPPVTEVGRPQAAHSHRWRRSSTHARCDPQPGHEKPPASATPPGTQGRPSPSQSAPESP